jgi:feruloyl esterase
LDGVKDGLIQDPRRCALNTAALICGPSKSSNCLTGRQLDTLLSIFRGPGQNIYPGLPMSDISGDDGWSQWVVGNTTPQFGVAEPWGAPPASFSTAPWDFSFQDQLLKYFVFSDPNYNSLSFRFNNTGLGTYASGPDTDASGLLHPNLSTFIGPENGGKLLIYHGWSDPVLAPAATIDYFNTILQQNGGDLGAVEDSVRLFMVPGMHHCGGGPGPNNTNWFNPMFFWRDFDVQPDNIVLNHFQNNDPNTGIVTRSMPVCAYPETAKYDGSGDVNNASSWTCVAPGN